MTGKVGENITNSRLAESQNATSENSIGSLACKIVCFAGIGSLSAWASGIIPPAGGSIFIVSMHIAQYPNRYLIGHMGLSSSYTKTTAKIAAFIINIGIATLITTSMGFPITTLSGAKLFLAAAVTIIVINAMADATSALRNKLTLN